MLDNILLLTDSYKVSHWRQYPPGTQRVFSFLEARKGGRHAEVTFFGLSYLIQKHLRGRVVTPEKIDEAERFFLAHFGDATLFNRAGWERIVDVHGGRLPVEIKAIPEGTTVPTGNVLLTIENTDPALPWLVNYLETLLVQVWYPTTVATQSRAMKADLKAALSMTGDPNGLGFKLHDFGYRGSTSVESAAIGGCAHLVNFMGTDTMAALELADKYYFEPMAGFSIPAAEHSTITSWGRAREREAYENMLDQYPKGLVAVVSDSYNIYEAVQEIWGQQLRDKVLARDGVVVIRPDSGDPPFVILTLLRSLGATFGYTTNEKGFRVLNPKVRLIQGDGIDHEMLTRIISAMVAAGWSLDNIAFGSGGGLLQKVNRDTDRFAMKCSAVQIDGEWHGVMKSPVGERFKQSKPGRLALLKDENGQFYTQAFVANENNLLQTVFRNGSVFYLPTLAEIRARAEEGL